MITEKESIEIFKSWLQYNKKHKNILREEDKIIAVQETILNLIQKLQKEVEKKDKIIDSAINQVEQLRQYFDEDLQPDFIRILEILKDKKVIDW